MPRAQLNLRRKRKLVLEDSGPPVWKLVHLARYSNLMDRSRADKLIDQMADKLEWLGKSYGLWMEDADGNN